jgi:hypothetical protein
VGSTTYNPLSLPTTIGKEPLCNRAGNAITTFGADIFTWSLFPAYSRVIISATFEAGAGVATGLVDVENATADTARDIPGHDAATSIASVCQDYEWWWKW